MRIVSLVPEATQWLAAFETADSVIGQSADGKAQHVPVIESPEHIRFLEPDLIVTRTPLESVAAIQQVVFDPRSLKNILEVALLLAHKSGGFAKGMAVIAAGEKRLAELTLRLLDFPRIPAVVLSGVEPLTVAGKWFPDLLMHAGGECRFATSGLPDTPVLPDQLEGIVSIVCIPDSEDPLRLPVSHWILDGTRYGKADPAVFDTIELLAYALHGSAAGAVPSPADLRFVDA